MRQIRSFFSIVACLTIGLTAAVSCTTATDPEPIESISLEPGFDSVEVGGTFDSWVLVLKDAAGNTLTGRSLIWESNNPAAATIDRNTGVVTGVNPGETAITVRGDGKQATAGIRVLVPVLGVVATPDSFDLPLTTTRSIGLQLFGPDGVALTNRLVVWSSQNPGIAVVSTTGVVTAVSLGTTTITARVASKEETIRVRVIGEPATSVRILPQQAVHVLRLGQSKQLTAECLSGTGQVLVGRPVLWSSSNPVVATVSSSGLVAAVGVGGAAVNVTCDNTASAGTSIQVTLVPVTSVTISPASLPMTANTSAQLTAIARDSTGAVLPLQNRQVLWTSSNNPVAQVTPLGVVFSFTAGIAEITVSVDGVLSPPATITVTSFFALRTTPPWPTVLPARPVGELQDR